METVRHALFAEHLGPVLVSWQDAQDMDIAGLSGGEKLRVAKAKVEAAERIPPLRSLLMLDDG